MYINARLALALVSFDCRRAPRAAQLYSLHVCNIISYRTNASSTLLIDRHAIHFISAQHFTLLHSHPGPPMNRRQLVFLFSSSTEPNIP